MDTLDRIKFDASSDDILVWKYPSDEIKIGSQLIVNQSQEAILVKGGQALDLYGPGTHTLVTPNFPLLNKIVNLAFGNQTPFTAEIWFFNKTAKRDLGWGTNGLIPLMDPKINVPINLGANGYWGLRIKDSRNFYSQVVGTIGITNARKIVKYFTGEIAQRVGDMLSKIMVENKVSIFDINSKLNELSKQMENNLFKEFDRFGIEITNFNIESIRIPQEEMAKIQEVYGKKMEIDLISNSKVGSAYTTMKILDSIEKAAENDSGIANAFLLGGAGISIGAEAGRRIGQNIAGSTEEGSSQVNKSIPGDAFAKMNDIKKMLDAGLISKEEYDMKKKDILDKI